MSEREKYLLKYIPSLTDEEMAEIPEKLCRALAENGGSFGDLELVAQLWKMQVCPEQSELEEAGTVILDMWDERVLDVTNAVKIPEVTRAFTAFRDALRAVRVERYGRQFSVKG